MVLPTLPRAPQAPTRPVVAAHAPRALPIHPNQLTLPPPLLPTLPLPKRLAHPRPIPAKVQSLP